MRNKSLLVLLFLLSAPSAIASEPDYDFSGYPTIPADLARAKWGSSPGAEMLRASEIMRGEKPLKLFTYPGERDVFNNLPMGDTDTTRVDTDVYLNLDNEEGALHVETRITMVALADDVDFLEFYLEFPEMVELYSTPELDLEWTLENGVLELDFSQPLPVEEEVMITFKYKGVLDCEVKFMLPTCKLKGEWKYITHSQFLPYVGWVDDVFVGTMRLIVFGKDYLKYGAGGTGTFMGSKLLPEDEAKEIVFEHVFPTSLYAFSLAKFATVHSSWGELPISSTVRPGQLKTQGTILGLVQDILTFYSDIYTFYPWNNLDVVAMPNSFSGGFGPLSTVFVLKNTLDATWDNNSVYGAMQLLAHEIGHEWWGNLVEMADMSAIILSEGGAEFSSNLFFQHATGSRWPFIQNNMSYTFTVPHDQEPLMISPFIGGSPYYYQVAYQKGATVFDMLRLEIGDDLLLAGMKEVTEKYFMQYGYPQDLFDVLSDVSGTDLTYFYDQWLAGRGTILALVESDCREAKDGCRITLTQQPQEEQDFFRFNLPVHIELVEGKTEEIMVRVEDWTTVMEFDVKPEEVRRIWVDGLRQLARIWLPALPGDIDLSGIVDGADLVEMSFAYKANIVVQAEWGEYFFANPYYNELADIATNDGVGAIDGRVNEKDLDVLIGNLGETANQRGDNE